VVDDVGGAQPGIRPITTDGTAPASWANASLLARQIEAACPIVKPAAWYRFADGWLGLSPAGSALARQFAILYGDCRTDPPVAEERAQVLCRVIDSPATGTTLIRFHDPEPLDQVAFLTSLFPDRDVRVNGGPPSTTLSTGIGPVQVGGDWVLVRQTDQWQLLIANLAIHRVLRLQPDLLCLHAASVVVNGQGIVLLGDKGLGKTTIATALAARGHGFLGDEIAAIHLPDLTLRPFRRAVSIRDGPGHPAVQHALERANPAREIYPDGSARRRIAMGDLFPGSLVGVTPLRWLVFLEPRASRTALTPFRAGPAELHRLNPLASSLWGAPPARQAFRALRLLGQIRTARLVAGDPAETVAHLERLVEE
jgi:hypothetical protein